MSSIRRRLLLVGGGFAFLVILGTVGTVVAGISLGRSDAARIERYAHEREAGNQAMRGILRQLSAGSASDPVQEFTAAGDEVKATLESFASQDLSDEERERLRILSETHAAMEEEATRLYEFMITGQFIPAFTAWDREISIAYDFLDDLEGFLSSRQASLENFRAGHARTFALLITLGGVFGAAIWIGGGMVAWTIHRRVARPMGRLSAAASRIGSGDLDVRIPMEEDAEFQTVSVSFNRMVERLQETTAALKEKNSRLTEALERVKETQADLIQSEKLSAMGRMTAGLAHELNNPLTTVLGYAQLLDEELVEEAPLPSREVLRQDFVAPIIEDTRRAGSLIREFLQLARKAPSSLSPVSLRTTLDQVRARAEAATKNAGVEVEITSVPDVYVSADSVMLEGIFFNLVTNAVDAITDGHDGNGKVRIGATLDGDRVVVSVSDNGPGLAQPDRVFEPFYTSKPVGKGTGLGLSLVHQFVEIFGGTVRARNMEDGGACFVVALPVVEGPSEDVDGSRPHASGPPTSVEEDLSVSPRIAVPDGASASSRRSGPSFRPRRSEAVHSNS